MSSSIEDNVSLCGHFEDFWSRSSFCFSGEVTIYFVRDVCKYLTITIMEVI